MRSRLRSCSLLVRSAARTSSSRASAVRPSRASRSARTAGSRWYRVKPSVGDERVDDLERFLRAVGHGDGDGAVELDDRATGSARRGVVQRDDLRPVGLLRRCAPGRGTRRSRPAGCTGPSGRRSDSARSQCGETRARSAAGPSARGSDRASRIGRPSGPSRARKREAWISISATQAVHLGLVRHQPCQHPPEAQRFLAQLRPHPVVAGRRRVALVEDEVDDLEHRSEARRPAPSPRAPRTAPSPR